MWKVYCYTNQINNKKYVGVTKKTVKGRAGKQGREYIDKNQSFGKAILKYGWCNFKMEILAQTENEIEAEELEKYYIKKFKSNDICFGYNRNDGGTIPTQKEVNQYDKSGNFIKTFKNIEKASKDTNISGLLIIECCRKNIKIAGDYIWRYTRDSQKYFTEKEMTPFSGERRVNQLDKDRKYIATYNSAKEAEKETGACRSKICMCCKGLRNTAGGFCWEYTEGFGLKDIYNPTPSPVKRVLQYELDGTFIAEYASQNEAHRQTGFSASMIGECCKEIRKIACGYIWRYKN